MQTVIHSLPQTKIVRDLALVVLASFLISLSGLISIPLWFTPIPLVLRNSVVLLIAAYLGPQRGAAAVFAFLMQGAMGFPIFANGTGGIAPFFGPLGGYLIGYVAAAFATGYLAQKKASLANYAFALGAGHLIIYFCGATYLSTFVGPLKAIGLGVLPFLIGDALKLFISLKVLQMKPARERRLPF